MHRPRTNEYAPYFERYIALVPEDDILGTMETQLADALAFLRSIPEDQSAVRHPPYTWTIKEVIGHLIDCERIFAYRALRFARGDATPLTGFEENDYVREAEFDRLPLRALIGEFEAARRSHMWLFRNLSEAAWLKRGEANSNTISVRAVAYIMVGHVRHHLAIVRKRLTAAA